MQNIIPQSLSNSKPSRNLQIILILFLTIFLLHGSSEQTEASDNLPKTTTSKDGSIISYETYGEGDQTLIFVHGWCCDSRYWREQISFFSKKYKMVLVDLAGHGHSSSERKNYTMKSFGEDIKAVIDATNSDKVILIGHSMGGPVIAETARLVPDKIIALVGIDTLENIEYPMTDKIKGQILGPLEKNFRNGCSNIVNGMFSNSTDQSIRNWVVSDMSAAPHAVALSANNAYFDQYITGESAKIFEEIKLPIYCVNGEIWPINYEANRRHMQSFDATVLKGAGHFLMLARPNDFNEALDKTIIKILKKHK